MTEELAKSEALSKTNQPFGITNVPWILYNELRKKFGIGDEVCSGGLSEKDFIRRSNLDPANPLLGGPWTAVARLRFGRAMSLRLWDYHWEELFERLKGAYDRPTLDDFVSIAYRPVLEISAGPRSDGIWSAGKGNHLVEAGKIEMLPHDLKSRDIPFMTMVMLRAHQIALHPSCTSDSYWEVQKNPEGIYTEP